jgi:hypothetical protein
MLRESAFERILERATSLEHSDEARHCKLARIHARRAADLDGLAAVAAMRAFGTGAAGLDGGGARHS